MATSGNSSVISDRDWEVRIILRMFICLLTISPGACYSYYTPKDDTIYVFGPVVESISTIESNIDDLYFKKMKNGDYLLNASLIVNDSRTTFLINGKLRILKTHNIIVYGTFILNDSVITSWNISSNDVIRNFSENRPSIISINNRARISNSEVGYLGHPENSPYSGFYFHNCSLVTSNLTVFGSFNDMMVHEIYDSLVNVTVKGEIGNYGILIDSTAGNTTFNVKAKNVTGLYYDFIISSSDPLSALKRNEIVVDLSSTYPPGIKNTHDDSNHVVKGEITLKDAYKNKRYKTDGVRFISAIESNQNVHDITYRKIKINNFFNGINFYPNVNPGDSRGYSNIDITADIQNCYFGVIIYSDYSYLKNIHLNLNVSNCVYPVFIGNVKNVTNITLTGKTHGGFLRVDAEEVKFHNFRVIGKANVRSYSLVKGAKNYVFESGTVAISGKLDTTLDTIPVEVKPSSGVIICVNRWNASETAIEFGSFSIFSKYKNNIKFNVKVPSKLIVIRAKGISKDVSVMNGYARFNIVLDPGTQYNLTILNGDSVIGPKIKKGVDYFDRLKKIWQKLVLFFKNL